MANLSNLIAGGDHHLSYIFCKDSTIQMLYSELDMTSGVLYYPMFCKMHQTEHRSHRHRSGTSAAAH